MGVSVSVVGEARSRYLSLYLIWADNLGYRIAPPPKWRESFDAGESPARMHQLDNTRSGMKDVGSPSVVGETMGKMARMVQGAEMTVQMLLSSNKYISEQLRSEKDGKSKRFIQVMAKWQ